MKRWAMAGGVALLVLLGLVWSQRSDRGDVPAPEDGAAAEDAATTPRNAPVGLRWTVGSAQHYQVRFDSAMRMHATDAGALPVMRVRMAGSLAMRPLDVSGDEALVGMQLSVVDLRINGQSDSATDRALSAPFRVRFASGGIPDAFEFPAGVDARQRSMLETLVRTFQVTVEAGDTWTVRESNASGTYAATYRRTAPQQVEKTKARFRNFPSASMLNGATIVSTETIQLDSQRDWLVSMTVDEILQSPAQGGVGMEITNLASITLQSTPSTAVPADTWRFVAAAAPPAAEARPPGPSLAPEDARRRILATLPELDMASEGRTRWIHRLRDLLRVDASLPGVLLAEMQTQPFSDRTRADLYLALELAGTESAQAALVSVIDDADWSSRDAMRAIVALAGVNDPSADTIAALWDTVDQVPASDDRQQLAGTATLALGSLGSTLYAAADPDYALLRERLLNGALISTGADRYTDRRTTYVHAMGNTGDSSLTGDVALFLEDEAPAVRRAAALSLKRLGTDPVADELVQRLNQEQSSAVRGAIAEALVAWTTPSPSAMASVGDAIRTEPDENARYHMVHFLGSHLDAFPENRAILQDLLRTEKSKRIRQRIANTLAAVR